MGSKDYKNGRIYCIRNNIDDGICVGSTTQTLSKRMCEHRWRSKNPGKKHQPLYAKMNELGVDCFYIELIEYCQCDTLEELMMVEGKHIRQIGTWNISIPGRTSKEWREHNKERVLECRKIYSETHKDELKLD